MSPTEAAQHKNPNKRPASKTSLCKSIRSLIYLTLICSGGLVSQNSVADTTDTRNEDTIEVTHPRPSDPEPDPWPGSDVSNGGNHGGGGDGGQGSTGPHPRCTELLARKPPQCPNPIPLPGGPEYGRERYPNGSGLAKLLYYREQPSHVTASPRTSYGSAEWPYQLYRRRRLSSQSDQRTILPHAIKCMLITDTGFGFLPTGYWADQSGTTMSWCNGKAAGGSRTYNVVYPVLCSMAQSRRNQSFGLFPTDTCQRA